MTEPNDETQVGFTPPDQTPARATDADATPGVILPPPGPASAGAIPAPAPPPLGAESSAPVEPDPAPPAVSPADPAAPAGSVPPGTVPPAGGTPPLRADPNRPAASGWREPPWFPPRRESRGPSIATVVVGLVILAVGLYYLLNVTFGVSLPRVSWSALWPVALIVVGGLIVLRAASRR